MTRSTPCLRLAGSECDGFERELVSEAREVGASCVKRVTESVEEREDLEGETVRLMKERERGRDRERRKRECT